MSRSVRGSDRRRKQRFSCSLRDAAAGVHNNAKYFLPIIFNDMPGK
jgi:gamma-glutamylcysteine synthetase